MNPVQAAEWPGGADVTVPTASAIEQRLRERLSPTALEVLDESYQHAGHAGANDSGVLIIGDPFRAAQILGAWCFRKRGRQDASHAHQRRFEELDGTLVGCEVRDLGQHVFEL